MQSLNVVCRLTVLVTVLAALVCSAAQAQEDVALLTIPDTTVTSYDTVYSLSFYLANPVRSIGLFELNVVADRPDLLELISTLSVDTFIDCNGSVCDTTIANINRVDTRVAGSPLQYWDYVQARALTPGYLRVVAIANLPIKPGDPAPLAPTDTPMFLFGVPMRRVAEPWLLDTLTDRTTLWLTQEIGTSFADPTGQTVPFPDTVICWDPPACTNVDTVPQLASGAMTIGPYCPKWGDVNRDGVITSADIIGLVSYVFKGGTEPGCGTETGDANCDGSVTSADIIFLVVHVFKGGPAPCVP